MDRRHRLLKRVPWALGALAVLAFAGLVWWIAGVVAAGKQKPARVVQTVQVIRPPPPPPDEPPPPPPPPDKIDEPLPQDTPEPTPSDAPTPSEQLGLDADGAAGSDGFGLAARRGGSDIAGSGGAAFAWYTGLIKDQLLERLADDGRVRARKFTVVVKVWIAPDGTIQEARLASRSGSRDVDSAIEAALGALGRLREGPPLEMPQPVSLRVVSRS